MSDIYSILAKFFDGEANASEEKIVAQFKVENLQEYQTLKRFWSKKEIKLSEFDSAKGLEKVKSKFASSKPTSRFHFRKTIAAAAAFLLLALFVFVFKGQKDCGHMSEIVTTQNKEKIELADGSLVYLNKNSKLIFHTKLKGDIRSVTLQGEAFFDITKDVNRPFVVHANHADIEVLGTSFNINTWSGETEVIVKTGKVNVESLNDTQSVELIADQTARITESNIESSTTIDKNYLAWKTGVFQFEQSTIQEVLDKLETYYGNRITRSGTMPPCSFTSTLKQLELAEVIEIIKLSCDLQSREKNGTYELYK